MQGIYKKKSGPRKVALIKGLVRMTGYEPAALSSSCSDVRSAPLLCYVQCPRREVRIAGQVDAKSSQTCFITRCRDMGQVHLTVF